MQIPGLLTEIYDNWLLYYPNIFFVVMAVVISVGTIALLRAIIIFFLVITNAIARLYSKKEVGKKSILKKYDKFYRLTYKFLHIITVRIMRGVRVVQKEIFINPKDL